MKPYNSSVIVGNKNAFVHISFWNETLTKLAINEALCDMFKKGHVMIGYDPKRESFILSAREGGKL